MYNELETMSNEAMEFELKSDDYSNTRAILERQLNEIRGGVDSLNKSLRDRSEYYVLKSLKDKLVDIVDDLNIIKCELGGYNEQ